MKSAMKMEQQTERAAFLTRKALEFLGYYMKRFKGEMIGATNFTDTLDPAVVRRFTFKLLDQKTRSMYAKTAGVNTLACPI